MSPAVFAGLLRCVLPGLLLLSLIFAAGCRDREPAARAEVPVQGPELLLGIVPEQNIFTQLERYEPIVAYLSRQTGLALRLRIRETYDEIIGELATGKLQGAFMGSYSYVLAREKTSILMLARPELNKFGSSYRGLIFARKESGIRNAADLKGRSFAFTGVATTAGYLFPLVYFRENHIDDYRKYFSDYYFAGSHQDTVMDVLEKRADAGAAKSTVFYELQGRDPRLQRDLVIIAGSEEVPENGLALRTDVGGEKMLRIKSALLAMQADPAGLAALKEFGARRFIECRDEDFRNVYRYAGLAASGHRLPGGKLR